MALATGWGRRWEPWPGLCWAVRSLFGRGPSALKPFVAAGCCFPIRSFSPFTLSLDRKPPALPTLSSRQVWETEELCRGYSGGSPVPVGVGLYRGIRKPTLQGNQTSSVHSSVCFSVIPCIFWALVFLSVQWARWFGSDALWLWVLQGITGVPKAGTGNTEKSLWVG